MSGLGYAALCYHNYLLDQPGVGSGSFFSRRVRRRAVVWGCCSVLFCRVSLVVFTVAGGVRFGLILEPRSGTVKASSQAGVMRGCRCGCRYHCQGNDWWISLRIKLLMAWMSTLAQFRKILCGLTLLPGCFSGSGTDFCLIDVHFTTVALRSDWYNHLPYIKLITVQLVKQLFQSGEQSSGQCNSGHLKNTILNKITHIQLFPTMCLWQFLCMKFDYNVTVVYI